MHDLTGVSQWGWDLTRPQRSQGLLGTLRAPVESGDIPCQVSSLLPDCPKAESAPRLSGPAFQTSWRQSSSPTLNFLPFVEPGILDLVADLFGNPVLELQ